MSHVKAEPLMQTLKDRVEFKTGESVALCYQCGKCSAGCPLADEMDIAPNQILRMLQLNIKELEDKVLGSLTIWLCLTCETCYSRCPKDVDLPQIMDYLRKESIKRGLVNPKAKKILAFHESFLNTVKSGGRTSEVGMVINYKLKTFDLMQDVFLSPVMLAKGKLKLLSGSVKNKAAIAKIFEKAKSMEDEK